MKKFIATFLMMALMAIAIPFATATEVSAQTRYKKPNIYQRHRNLFNMGIGTAAGAIIGGATGAAIGAQAEQRHGYYLWQGVCYYRYPSGQYAAVDPHYCN